jgi:hypothetical protein
MYVCMYMRIHPQSLLTCELAGGGGDAHVRLGEPALKCEEKRRQQCIVIGGGGEGIIRRGHRLVVCDWLLIDPST